jgi:hypothetical protein
MRKFPQVCRWHTTVIDSFTVQCQLTLMPIASHRANIRLRDCSSYHFGYHPLSSFLLILLPSDDCNPGAGEDSLIRSQSRRGTLYSSAFPSGQKEGVLRVSQVITTEPHYNKIGKRNEESYSIGLLIWGKRDQERPPVQLWRSVTVPRWNMPFGLSCSDSRVPL